MGPVRGDQDMVARAKTALIFALDAQTRRPGEEQDPFVVSLTMGLICRRRLARRDDALDANIFSQQNFGKNLIVGLCGDVIKEIGHASASGLAKIAQSVFVKLGWTVAVCTYGSA
jgi:hypothetical protein